MCLVQYILIQIKSMVNLQLTAPEMEQHVLRISGKKKKKLLFELEKNESKKPFKILTVNNTEPSVQSEQSEPELN